MTIALHTHSTLAENKEWCASIAQADVLPRQYRGKPANLLFAIEYADALGIARINALTSIHIVDGKPTASADLIASMIRRAGHKLRITGDDTYAEASLIRADDPDFEFKVRWDVDKARKAGLWGKAGPWKNYPAAMMRSRAITEVGRMGASDALSGVIYTPEELGATIDEDGNPVQHDNRRAPAVEAQVVDAATAQADADTFLERITEAETARSVDSLRALWNEAGRVLTPDYAADLRSLIESKVAAISAPAVEAQDVVDEQGVLDAEVVEPAAA